MVQKQHKSWRWMRYAEDLCDITKGKLDPKDAKYVEFTDRNRNRNMRYSFKA